MDSKQWKIDNPERARIHTKRYRQKHKARIAKYQEEYMKQYRKDNPEYMKQYRKDNPGCNDSEYNKQWRKDNPDKMREIYKRKANKRRDLGFNPLNKYFEGSEAHHINKNDIVYILKELHQSIPHCLKTGKNMDKINRLAMENANII